MGVKGSREVLRSGSRRVVHVRTPGPGNAGAGVFVAKLSGPPVAMCRSADGVCRFGTACRKPLDRDRYIDARDGHFDLSDHLLKRRGLLPVPIIITEPALG